MLLALRRLRGALQQQVDQPEVDRADGRVEAAVRAVYRSLAAQRVERAGRSAVGLDRLVAAVAGPPEPAQLPLPAVEGLRRGRGLRGEQRSSRQLDFVATGLPASLSTELFASAPALGSVLI